MTTTLGAGGIAIIGYNADMVDGTGNPAVQDKIHFVLTQAITQNTVIHFTDRTWTHTAGSTALGAGTFSNSGTDGTYTWTASRAYAAGEVVTLSQAQLHGAGFNFDHNASEVIWAYQGTADAPTHFLWALEAGTDVNFNSSLVNTGLTAGYTAGAIAGDSAAYAGPTTHAQTFLANGAGTTILHAIADATNWVYDNQDGQNALEQPVQTQNWFVHHDVDIWSAALNGGGGIVNVGGDLGQGAGAIGQQISHLYNNLLDGNGTSVFWALTDVVVDTVNGKFFVSDSDITGGHNRILQGNIADLLGNPGTLPTLTVLYSDTGVTTASTIDTLEIDKTNGIIYFTHGSKVEKIVYNNANQTATTLFEANVADNPAGSGSNFFGDIAINFNTNEIYLSSYRVTTFTSSDSVTKNYVYKLTGLTANAGANHFTFANGKAGLLPFSPDDNDTTAGAGVLADEGFPKEEGTISGLAIDPLTNTLYFTTGTIRFDHDGNSGTPAQTVRGGIFKYNLNTGQNPNGLYVQIYEPTDDGDTNSQAIQPNFGPQGLLNDIEIDYVNGKWYAVDYTGDQLGAVNPPGDEGFWQGNLNEISPGNYGTPVFFGDINNINGLVPAGFTLNNAPTLSGSQAGTPAVTEASSAPNSGETGRVTLFTGISIADANTSNAGDEITGAVVRIGEGFTYEAASTASGHTGTIDRLYINNSTGGSLGSGISFTYNEQTGAMVLTGAATVAEYKAAIELVQFSTSGDNVTNNGNGTTRKIYVSVSDGLTKSDEVVATVNVTGINDAPVNAVGAAMNFTEDTTGTVGQTVPSVVAPVNAITGISIADADADATSETFSVTLSVNFGTLTVRTDVTGGVTSATGNGSASVTISGTQNQINATLAATTLPAQGSQPNGLVYTPPANFNGAARLTVVTNDNGNNGNDPNSSGGPTDEADTDVKTLNVADTNDAPTVTDGTQDAATILEDTPTGGQTVTALFNASFSDAIDNQHDAVNNPTGYTGDTLAGIAVVANGSNASGKWEWSTNGTDWFDVGAASADAAKTFQAGTLLRFNPALNFNGAAPTLTAHLIESGGPAITDGGTVDLNPLPGAGSVYTTGTVVLSQAVTPVNDAPTISNLGGNTVTWTEGDASPARYDALLDAIVGDVDSANFDGGTLTVTYTNGLAEDAYTINTAGQVSVTPDAGPGFGTAGTIAVGGTLIGTYTFGNSGFVFTFNADATPARVQELVRALGYSNTGGDNPTAGDRTVSFTLVDNDGTANGGDQDNTYTSKVTVVATNDAPVATTSAGKSAFVEAANATSTPVAVDPGITVADPDSPIASATVAVTTGEGADQLNFVNDSAVNFGNIAMTTGPAGSITLQSAGGTATLTQWQNALRAVTYTSTSENPATSDRVVTFTLSDGTDSSSPATKTVSVAATNDAPEITAQNADIDGTEDSAIVFNSANSKLITLADPEGGTLTVTLAVTRGTVTLATTNNLTMISGLDGSATVKFSGSVTDVNAALNGLKYLGDLNFEGTDALDITVEDTSGASDTQTIDIELLDDGKVNGNGADNDLDGTPGADMFYMDQAGTEEVDGLGGNDAFLFGAFLDATDQVDGGEGTKDQLGIQGNYGIVGSPGTVHTLGAGNLVNIETLALLSGTETFFGAPGGQSFDYNLKTVDENVENGKTLTVNMNGLQAGEDVIFDGSAETNGKFFFYAGAGVDKLTGGDGNDGFFFGNGLFGAGDEAHGGDGMDQMGLRGNYNVGFGEQTMTGIETLALLSGTSTRFGPPSPDYSYNVTVHENNVASNGTLSINANELTATESVIFNGAAEQDGGKFSFKGGKGADSFTGGGAADEAFGGLGQDTLTGGGGADRFVYTGVAQSTGTAYDRLLDFDFAVDKIDLPGAGPFSYDITVSGSVDSADFNDDLAALLSGHLADVRDFAFVSATSGTLSGKHFLVVDANGIDGYQAGQDYVFEVTTPPVSPIPDFLM
jgi:hypothetical protein